MAGGKLGAHGNSARAQGVHRKPRRANARSLHRGRRGPAAPDRFYPKHVDQADRRLDWREVITRGVSESGSAHHATWLLDRSIAEANEREYRKEASCLADARHTLVYKQPKKAPREAGLRSKKILRLRVVNAS